MPENKYLQNLLKKILFITVLVFIQIVVVVICAAAIIFVLFKMSGGKQSDNPQYFANLDWVNKDINDIPAKRNVEQTWETTPGSKDTYIVRINSQGLRDYEYVLEKPKNALRIIVVGDSVTFGCGVNLEETYVKQLERLLNEGCSRRAEVINFGVNGASTINELELIQKKGLLYKPDIIVLQMDPNDSQIIHQIRQKDDCLNWIILELKKNNFKISSWLKTKLGFYKYYRYRKTLTTQDAYNNVANPLKEIISTCKENNIKLAIISYDPAYHPDYYPAVLAYIAKEGIPLLNLAETKFGGLSYKEKYVNPALDKRSHPIDGHPNKFGNRIMAEEVNRFLSSMPEVKNGCAGRQGY